MLAPEVDFDLGRGQQQTQQQNGQDTRDSDKLSDKVMKLLSSGMVAKAYDCWTREDGIAQPVNYLAALQSLFPETQDDDLPNYHAT